MDIRWSPEAADDLERIVDRIEQENPDTAHRVANLIYERCGSLADLPHRGRPGRIDGTRELIFAPLPYIVVYRVRAKAVEIARIYHSAQDWP